MNFDCIVAHQPLKGTLEHYAIQCHLFKYPLKWKMRSETMCVQKFKSYPKSNENTGKTPRLR